MEEKDHLRELFEEALDWAVSSDEALAWELCAGDERREAIADAQRKAQGLRAKFEDALEALGEKEEVR